MNSKITNTANPPAPSSKPKTFYNNLWLWIKKPKEEKGFIREWIETIIFVVAMWLIITEFIIQNFFIPSSSMESTLLINDRIFVNRFIYRLFDVERNEIIVFRFPLDSVYPSNPAHFIKFPLTPIFVNKKPAGLTNIFLYHRPRDFIKRAVGLPGDTIEMINKTLYVNGKISTLPEAANCDNRIFFERDYFGPVKIPKKGDIIEFSKLNLFELYCIEKYFAGKKMEFSFRFGFTVDNTIYEDTIITAVQSDTQSTLVRYLAVEVLRLKNHSHSIIHRVSDVKINGISVGNYTMPEDCYIALGDNRDNSHDSRFWGYVPASIIKGKPMFIYWPLTRLKIF